MERDLGAAIAAYNEALRLQPNYLQALLNLSTALLEKNDGIKALAVARRALVLKRGSWEALERCAKAALLCSQVEEALAFADEAVSAHPRSFEALELKARVLGAVDRDGNTKSLYREFLAIEAGHELASARLADLHLATGEAAEALAVSNACLSRVPSSTRALASKVAALTALGRKAELDSLQGLDRLISVQRFGTVPGFAAMADFHAALVHHILQHPSLSNDPQGLATRSGRHSGELLIEPKGPIAAFEQMVVSAVVDYAKAHPASADHPFLAAQPSRWSLTIWAIVLGAEGYQVPHHHPSGWLSGVYYLALPAGLAAAHNSRKGWIEFGRPPQVSKGDAEPELKYFEPKEGVLLLFPSYLHHRTIPTGRDELRISIAFDVLPHDQSPGPVGTGKAAVESRRSEAIRQ
jgi:uncharacterized protein (TIGR02466 family)